MKPYLESSDPFLPVMRRAFAFEANTLGNRLQDDGNLKEAGRLARIILSKRDWHGFLPANAVMGVLMALEGDYVSSEVFFEAAVADKEKPPAVTCNDYADTLMHLGKFEKAEKYARRSEMSSPENDVNLKRYGNIFGRTVG